MYLFIFEKTEEQKLVRLKMQNKNAQTSNVLYNISAQVHKHLYINRRTHSMSSTYNILAYFPISVQPGDEEERKIKIYHQKLRKGIIFTSFNGPKPFL